MNQNDCKDVGSIFEDRFGFVYDQTLSQFGCGDVYIHPNTNVVVQITPNPTGANIHVAMWESVESYNKGDMPLSSMNASPVQ